MLLLWTLNLNNNVKKRFVASNELVNTVIERWINIYFPYVKNLVIGFDPDLKQTSFEFDYIGLHFCFTLGIPETIELIEFN